MHGLSVDFSNVKPFVSDEEIMHNLYKLNNNYFEILNLT